MASRAAVSEMLNVQKNCNFKFEHMEPNDVPKMYISVMRAFHTKEELISEGWTANRLRSEMAVGGAGDDEVCENCLSSIAQSVPALNNYVEKLGSCELTELRGRHEIMFDKPGECGALLKAFIEEPE